jgi:hypothetical protein
MKKVRVIDATLTNDSDDSFLVALIVTAVEDPHGSAVVAQVEEDQAETRLELLDKIPDGEYILEYFSPKPFRGRARVVDGILQVL